MEKDVKPLTELDDDLFMILSAEKLGQSFLLEFKNKFDQKPAYVEDIIKPIVDRNHDLIADVVEKYLLEAVQWLSNRGLIAEYIKLGQERKYFITRLGHKYLKPYTYILKIRI